MKSIRIKNLRSLVDTKEIKFNGLTVLVGENSSGKSTLIRSFPLFKQSIDSINTTALLWYGKYVDFENFSKCVNRKNNDRISFILSFDNILNSELPRVFNRIEKNVGAFKVEIGISKKEAGDYLSDINIYIEENVINIKIDKKNQINELIINDINYTEMCKYNLINSHGIIPLLANKNGRIQIFGEREENIFLKEIYLLLNRKLKFNQEQVIELLENIKFSRNTIILNPKDKKRGVFKNWIKLKSAMTNQAYTKVEQKKLRSLFLGYLLDELLFNISEKIRVFFKNTYYVAPIRSNAQRYYRIQNVAINEVDFEGQNLPMLLANMSETKLKEFAEWTTSNFKFAVKPTMSEGHISLNVIKDSEVVNITDCGFGYSQILPIITQLWLILDGKNRNKDDEITLVIEQPELHLHPKMQAELIDTFVQTINIVNGKSLNLKLVIETHSEVIIDRIGYLIEKRNINKEDVNIYIFNKKNVDETEIKESYYDDEGQLVEWPWDFFEVDE